MMAYPGGPSGHAVITEDAPTLPRLHGATIERMRLLRRLDAQVQAPVRLLIAPPGWGKTTLLSGYARLSDRRAYCRLMPGQEAAALLAGIATACGIVATPRDAAEVVEALSPLLPLTIMLDDIHLAAPSARAVIDVLARDAPEKLSLILAGSARTAVQAERWLADGTAALTGPDELAFDDREIAQLSLRLGVEASEMGIARLIRATEGWPIVVSGALRTAAALRRPIDDAYRAWAEAVTFGDFVQREVARAGSRAVDDFMRLLSQPGGESRDASAARLESEGLFVRRVGSVYRLHAPVTAALAARVRPMSDEAGGEIPMLQVRMFGSFDARLGAREILWVRRRDYQIVQYLLLRPEGSATRDEIIRTFWPDADRDAASQSLRTACSNIRKAFGAIVGAANVERYFCSRGDLAIRWEHASVDVRRFRDRVNDGDREFQAGRTEQALAHYLAAEALYVGDLLTDGAGEAWLVARRESLRRLYAHVLERSAEIWAGREQPALARRYAERLQAHKAHASLTPRMAAQSAAIPF